MSHRNLFSLFCLCTNKSLNLLLKTLMCFGTLKYLKNRALLYFLIFVNPYPFFLTNAYSDHLSIITVGSKSTRPKLIQNNKNALTNKMNTKNDKFSMSNSLSRSMFEWIMFNKVESSSDVELRFCKLSLRECRMM